MRVIHVPCGPFANTSELKAFKAVDQEIRRRTGDGNTYILTNLTHPNLRGQADEIDIVLIAPRHVRRAVEFMQANIGGPITITEVAASARVSVRALEKGFRAFLETTPAAYLRKQRMRAARMDLLDPLNRQSVKEICLKWGFFHFGRFSAVYKATYGECPSETKRRSVHT